MLWSDFRTWQQRKHQQIFMGNQRHLNYLSTASAIERTAWPTGWSMSSYALMVLENLHRNREALGCSCVENFSLHLCTQNVRGELLPAMQRNSEALGGQQGLGLDGSSQALATSCFSRFSHQASKELDARSSLHTIHLKVHEHPSNTGISQLSKHCLTAYHLLAGWTDP